MRPSRATTVSTPRTRSPSTACAFARAFSSATSAGSPSSRSRAVWGRPSNGIPSCSRSARRCGEAEARVIGSTSGARGEQALELVEALGPPVPVQRQALAGLEPALVEDDLGRPAPFVERKVPQGLDVVGIGRLPRERVGQASGRVDRVGIAEGPEYGGAGGGEAPLQPKGQVVGRRGHALMLEPARSAPRRPARRSGLEGGGE